MVAEPFLGKVNFLLIILCFIGLVLQTNTTSAKDFPDFETYCQKFNKKYENGQYQQRRQIYNQNIQKIINSNCSAMGVNMFTDSTEGEMQQLKGGFAVDIPKNNVFDQNSNNDSNSLNAAGLTLTDKTPLSYDWRDYKAVTSVKNQRSCGSCWAFSTTAFFQSDFIISNNYTNEIDLSQQFLLKCDNRSLQCNGGFLFWAMNRIIDETTGMPTEKQYPYDYSKISLQNGMCYQTDLIRVDQNKKMVAYFDVDDTKLIEKMILKKPVNVNLCSKDLQFYSPKQNSRTLFCDVNNAKRDHTVLLVGYTQTEWIIKNQWSNSWGVGGYGYISKNSSQDCCIGKQLYTTGVVSQNCSVANCSICVQETSCYQCKKGFYVYSSQGKHLCAACNQPYCDKCLNFFGLCDVCQVGYSVVYPYYTCKKSTIDNCSFMYNNQCGQCHIGYVLDMNGKCVAQKDACYVTGCQQCQEYQPGVCNTCSSGYTLNNFTSLCDKIPECNVENCSRCFIDNSNRCEICQQQGYEFSQIESKCVITCPIDGCQSCDMVNDTNTNTIEKQCIKCRSGYKLSQDKLSCQKCQLQYCDECQQNIISCSRCLNGFYFNTATSKCQSCSDIDGNCQQCSLDSNNQNGKPICTKCNNGFSVSENNIQCLRCLSECMTTSYSSLNKCSDQCGPMNYFDSNVCKACPLNCEQCSSSTLCTKCLSGFVLKDGICYKPCKQGAKCRNCRLDVNQSECLSCANGYKLQNDQCVFNPQDQCLQKNGLYPEDCVSCPQKYYMNPNYSRKVCSKCETVDENCIECLASSPSKCSKCADSYYLEKANQTCIKCDSFDVNCINCLANNYCTQCQQGYYLLSTQTNDENSGLCYPCDPSCLTCKYSSQFCTSCKQGYELTLSKKCLNKITIRFSIVIDADYDSVLNQFMMKIYDDLKEIFGLETTKEIDIFNVEKGSIKVTGDFHMPQGQTDSDEFLQDTRTKFYSRSNLGQYPILSSQASLYSDSPIIIVDPQPKMSMAILIGVAAGGGVFAIIVIVILIWAIRKYACKKEDINDKEQAKTKAQNNNPQIKKQKQVSQKSSSKSAKTANPNSQNFTNKKPLSTNQTDKYINEAYPYEYPQYLKNQDPTI